MEVGPVGNPLSRSSTASSRAANSISTELGIEAAGLRRDVLASTGTLSFGSAVILLTKINWGIGMMAMPYYFHCAGLYAGLAFFAVSMGAAGDAACCLARCWKAACENWKPSAMTYTMVMRACLGRAGEMVALICMFMASFGSSIAWIRFIGDSLAHFIPEIPLVSQTWCIIMTLLLLPCAFIDSVAALERVSGLGLLVAQCFALVFIGEALAESYSDISRYVEQQPLVRWSSAPVAMGLAVFCNEGMVVMVPPTISELRKRRSFHWVMTVMAVYFAINYIAVGVAGDLLFSRAADHDIASELTLNLSVTPLNRCCVCLYIAQVLMSFPVMLFALFTAVEWTPQSFLARRGPTRVLRVTIIGSAGMFAMMVPHFGDFLAVTGALGNSLIIYILPHLALYQAHKCGWLPMSVGRKVLSAVVVIVLGVGAGTLGTVVSVASLIKEGERHY